ncbi:MAG: GntR family transcriptional regulator [Oscillospiraceae bacterium]|nr:GntR family transcriptional regulator [Oscillospiraceae bacterium]
MILLDYRDARPIYAQICDGFREQICAGILRPGDKLPSVRELATQLTINPNTIQRAYRELEVQGWVESAAGKGSFVRGVPQNGGETQELLKEFDKLTARLLSAGVERETLLQHLGKGGNENA